MFKGDVCSLSGAADFKLPGDIAELRTERWAVVLRSLRGSGAGQYRGSTCRMKTHNTVLDCFFRPGVGLLFFFFFILEYAFQILL